MSMSKIHVRIIAAVLALVPMLNAVAAVADGGYGELG